MNAPTPVLTRERRRVILDAARLPLTLRNEVAVDLLYEAALVEGEDEDEFAQRRAMTARLLGEVRPGRGTVEPSALSDLRAAVVAAVLVERRPGLR